MSKIATRTITAAIILLISVSPALADGKPSFDIKGYGYFKLDGAYDRNLTSHGNFVMWVQPPANAEDDEQFNMTANETRFGVNLIGNGYGNLKVSGKLEMDLYASVSGVAENKAMLQLRHAYFAVESGRYKLLAGQSWDLISPLNPSTLNYSVLWGCGNIGYRRPQVSFWYNYQADKTTEIGFAAGFFRTIGTDLTPTFTLATGETVEGADDGTDAGIPSVQALFDLKHNLSNGGQMRGGFSGLWGKLKAETTLGNSEKYESWGFAAHAALAPSARFGLNGEFYTGSNLGSYFGAVLRNSEIDGLKSSGGWLTLWWQASKLFHLSSGFGIDDPDDDDFASGRSRNSCLYGTFRYTFIPQATLGVELSQWETKYKGGETADNFRGQTSLILNF